MHTHKHTYIHIHTNTRRQYVRHKHSKQRQHSSPAQQEALLLHPLLLPLLCLLRVGLRHPALNSYHNSNREGKMVLTLDFLH
jgi:hypothetical protein